MDLNSNPGIETTFVLKPAQSVKGLQKCLLSQIPGVFSMAHQPKTDVVDPILIFAHQALKRVDMTLQGLSYQGRIFKCKMIRKRGQISHPLSL